ncbi:hypothetical protein LCGC14_1310440 [marine sediment metagenome]|uniref:Periplasmic copper-binding protein NosD beta helix domain-containing protein n=1 Tax=marine sediment metagenome TaxID=412755 RepID=A0A0F9L7I7_9ZZZZ
MKKRFQLFTTLLILSISIFFSYQFSSGGFDSKEFDRNKPTNSVISSKILIDGNQGWVDFKNAGNCTGQGILTDPYIIENLIINGSGSAYGIFIKFSDVYFKITNCSVYNSGTGIELSNVDNGYLVGNNLSFNNYGIELRFSNYNTISGNIVNNNTADGIRVENWSNNNNISNNIALNNNYAGIILEDYCDFNQISGNIANNNNGAGIALWYSDNNTIDKNIVHYNQDNGIYLYAYSEFFENNTVRENSVADNRLYGINLRGRGRNNRIINNLMVGNGLMVAGLEMTSNIVPPSNLVNGKPIYYYINKVGLGSGDFFNAGQVILENCSNSVINDLNVSYGSVGISLFNSFNISIANNQANYNKMYGIYLSSSDLNTILDNEVKFNNMKGIELDYCQDNIIYLNNFIGNQYNAQDFIGNNQWDNGVIGNYWDDYDGKDTDDDGIGDTSYSFYQDAIDNYPIWWDPPALSIISPIESQEFGNNPPNFIISLDEGNADTMWYSINTSSEKYYFTELNGSISQELWESIEEGNVKITFYVSDLHSLIDSQEVNLIKQIPLKTITIPGYNLIFLLVVISFGVKLIFIRIRRKGF